MRTFIFTLLLIGGSLAAAQMTGSIEKGLRMIPIDPKSPPDSISVFRGDYIVLVPPGKQTVAFTVKELGIDSVFPLKGKTSYVKIKKAGNFKAAIDGKQVMLKVTELERPNYQAIDAKASKELIESADPLILDVRTQREFDSAHIKDAVLLPVQEIQKRHKELLKHKDRPILIYCASGNRSTVSARVLLDAGFTRIYNMRYGIREWLQKGYPVEK